MPRKVTREGLELIKKWEEKRLTAYKPLDHDNWTIGYGHTSAAGEPIVYQHMKISEAEAEEILKRDLVKFERVVNNLVEIGLTENQFNALVSLVFNIGETALRKSTLLKKLNAADLTGAQDQFRVWRKSGGKVVQGLVNRRAQEAALFGKGDFVASSYVDVKPAGKPVMTKENVTWGAGILATLASIFEGGGPIQNALAVVILLSFGIGAFFFIKKRINPA